MGETANQLYPVHNEQFVKERQEWLSLYQSACQRLGRRRWREKNRQELFAKVESQLWHVMRAKGNAQCYLSAKMSAGKGSSCPVAGLSAP